MQRYTVRINGRDITVDVGEKGPDRFVVALGNRKLDVELVDRVDLMEASITPAIEVPDAATVTAGEPLPVAAPSTEGLRPIGARPGPPAASSTSLLTAPLPGVIASVDVSPGARVTRGQTLLTLEAMKMRNAIRSPRDGVVAAVHVAAGQSVAHGEPLVDVKELPS